METLIPISLLEKAIENNAHKIQKLDGYELPMVLVEIQAEEASRRGVNSHKSITNVSVESIESVLMCWASDDDFEEWISDLLAQSVALCAQ